MSDFGIVGISGAVRFIHRNGSGLVFMGGATL